uniref:Uncharacterized protein n=1 Tax=Vespula pensylvanica TaxID=30213 RepID=A0A834JMD9_VESPE|nr:hypothetical protein H0235_018226 [Vespula pensylvanica]
MNSSQGPLIPNFIKIHSDGAAVIRSPQRNARTRYLGKMLQFLAVGGCSGLSITPGNYINYGDSKNGKTSDCCHNRHVADLRNETGLATPVAGNSGSDLIESIYTHIEESRKIEGTRRKAQCSWGG